MQRLLPLIALVALSAQPALAGVVSTPSLPSSGTLSLVAGGVLVAIYLARRKR